VLRDDRGWNGSAPSGVVFHYRPGRKGEYAAEILDGFNGKIQVDAYGGYSHLATSDRMGGDPLRLAFCWAHGRRKLIKATPKSGSPIVDEALVRIAALYKIEDNTRRPHSSLDRQTPDQALLQRADTDDGGSIIGGGNHARNCSDKPSQLYTTVREICDRYGVLLIFDEVMCGAGRTGTFLAAHHWPDALPDLVACAKELSAGYTPLGAMIVPNRIVDKVVESGDFLHGHTYSGNPLSSAIGVAVLRELDTSKNLPFLRNS